MTGGMEQIAQLRTLGLFDARVPRYTSYPTAPVFSPATGADFQAECLARLDPAEPVSVYVHIPFCERLCWFCACHTQGTRTLSPVESYLGTLEAELAVVARHLPKGVRMGRLHWGGGTPTILPPHMIARLSDAVRDVFPVADEFEFSVEIDPTMVDADKIAALRAAGLNRASIGIQDFSPDVQAAIGRPQSFEVTRDCVAMLREAGVASLNADLVYGLPHQDAARLADTVDKVLSLAPDRLALFGYAHVPHMSKRQKLIDEAALPGDEARFRLARLAAETFTAAGFRAIGIDHFALPGDGLARAAETGRLRRNFQGYTEDTCPTLIGLGTSSISRFRQGYVQNAPATPAYVQRIEAGGLAGAKGHLNTDEDLVRGRAIEMLMCDFAIDQDALRREAGPLADILLPVHAATADRFASVVARTSDGGIRLAPEGRPLARMVARGYDGYAAENAVFSKAS